jgi:hypothetical protein
VNGHFYDHYDTPGLQRRNTAHVQDNVQTTTSNLDIVSCFTKHRFITERIMQFVLVSDLLEIRQFRF